MSEILSQPEFKENQETSLDEKIHEIFKKSDYPRSFNRLRSELNNREDSRFNSLVNPELIGRLKVATNELEDLLAQKNASKEQLADALRGIAKIFESMLDTPRSRAVKDDSDSLRKVGFGLKGIRNMNEEVLAKIKQVDKSENKNDTKTLRTLLEKWNGLIYEKLKEVNRKVNAIENL